MDLSIGNELKDSFDETNKWVKGGIEWLSDVEEFYRTRASIEKEYSSKLLALSNDFIKRKLKVSTTLSVGETPTITPGSLEAASMVAWTEVLTRTEEIAKHRKDYSRSLEKKVLLELESIRSKYDSIRHQWKEFNEKIVVDRDHYYSEVDKAKKEYDSSCQIMEQTRQKTERSSSEKAQKKYKEKEIDMNILKNTYLIKINVANRLKDKYFYQDLPEILDGLQDLNESRVSRLNNILLTTTALEKSCNEKVNECLNAMDVVIKHNVPSLDTAMFIKHNLKDWKEPQDFYYIPSSIWHDDESMVTEPAEMNHLRIQLSTANAKYEKFVKTCETEKQILEEVLLKKKGLKEKYITGDELISKEEGYKYDELLMKYLKTLQNFTQDDVIRVVAEVEMETIQSSSDGNDLTAPIHEEKKSKRFGLFGKKTRHYTVPHTSDITSVHSNTNTMLSRSSTTTFSKARLFGSLLKSNTTTDSGSNAKALYDYEANGDDEVSISQGETFNVVNFDTDGSGWTEITKSSGEKGLVPTSYIETLESKASKIPPKVAPRRGAKKVQYLEALFDYEAAGDDELTIHAGDKIELITDDSDGWTEGKLNNVAGLFPSSYVKKL
ncbi:hypothetical protein LJB42_001085 [Komagataella kurtzmanii]|nr:hypothetical protein LJB42_001085 [Komagataella kurtzmanii]